MYCLAAAEEGSKLLPSRGLTLFRSSMYHFGSGVLPVAAHSRLAKTMAAKRANRFRSGKSLVSALVTIDKQASSIAQKNCKSGLSKAWPCFVAAPTTLSAMCRIAWWAKLQANLVELPASPGMAAGRKLSKLSGVAARYITNLRSMNSSSTDCVREYRKSPKASHSAYPAKAGRVPGGGVPGVGRPAAAAASAASLAAAPPSASPPRVQQRPSLSCKMRSGWTSCSRTRKRVASFQKAETWVILW
mmetsp:Transcript_102049/g.327479  ORF Transcript_102049/g.327479 Transcript_102049/m.327479 type:complete len:245 (-) Transcript_102049:1143-1877(-)